MLGKGLNPVHLGWKKLNPVTHVNTDRTFIATFSISKTGGIWIFYVWLSYWQSKLATFSMVVDDDDDDVIHTTVSALDVEEFLHADISSKAALSNWKIK